jgi:replicative DNA helicase
MATAQERQKSAGVPSDVAAERAVAAAVLVDASAIDDIDEIVDPADFHDPLCRAVLAAAVQCSLQGRAIDEITIADEMRRKKVLQRVGGPDALSGLVEEASHVAHHVTTHARIVSEKARLRDAIQAGREIAVAAVQPDARWDDVKETAEQVVFALSKEQGASSLVHVSKIMPEVVDGICNARESLLLGHSTGYAELDRLTGGFQAGQLIIVAARPSMGKSAFALQLAHHIAKESGLAVPFLSYEMSREELGTRLLAGRVGYDLLKLRLGNLPSGLDLELARVQEDLEQVPLFIDDNPPSSITGVRSMMRRMHRRERIGCIVVDYMQLMDGERRTRDVNRVEEVSEISRGLKRLASELEVPIVALSQLNRSLETRPNKRPMLSDLRESGSLEQDASTVLFLYRDSVYNPNADVEQAEIIIAKQRNGQSGQVVPVIFEGAKGARFVPSSESAHPMLQSAAPLAPARRQDFF